MKKHYLIILIFISTLFSCSDSENQIIRTDLDLLSEKKWNFDYFEFTSSSDNINNYSSEEIEQEVNNIYEDGNVSYEFFTNNSGEWNRNDEIDEFDWEFNGNNLLLDFANDDIDTDYILNSVTDNELNITFNHEVVIFIEGNSISVRGNYFYN